MKMLNKIAAVLLAVMLVASLATVASAETYTVDYGTTSKTVSFVIEDVYGFDGGYYVSGDAIYDGTSVDASFSSPTGEGGLGGNQSILFNNNVAPEDMKTGTVTVTVTVALKGNTSGSCTVYLVGNTGTGTGGEVASYSASHTITIAEPPHTHSWGDWVETKAPTCDEEGEETRTCSGCGETETRPVAKVAHTWGDWTQTKAPTCKAEGEETRTCSVCGETETRSVDKTKHNWSDWTQSKAPTCKAEGEETRTCSICGETETRPVDKIKHNWGEWEVTTEATCGKKGEKTRTCSICGETETESIAALEHKWGKWEVTEEATCTEDGEKTRECEHCGKKQTKVIKATGHEYEYEKINSKQHKATCKICGHSFKEDHEFQYNGYCVCGYKKPVASTAGLDDVPKTGDITGQLVFGASAAVIALMAAAAFVFKRKTAK